MCVIKNVVFPILEDADGCILFHKKGNLLVPPTFKFEGTDDLLLRRIKLVVEKKQFGINLDFKRSMDFLLEEENETINCYLCYKKLFVPTKQVQWLFPTPDDVWVPAAEVYKEVQNKKSIQGISYQGFVLRPLSAKALALYYLADLN